MRLRYALTLALAALAPAAAAQIPPMPPQRGGGPGSDVGQAVAVSPFLRTAVVGDFEQTADFGPLAVTSADAPAARSDVFVVVYDPFGAPLWARRMGTGVFSDFGGGVAFDTDQNVYVSGYFTGIATWDGGANPTVTITTRNDFDGFLAKYEADGDLLWVQQIGGPDQDVARGLAVADGVYVAGSFYGTATWGDVRGDTTITSLGSSDGYVAKYAPDGALQWVRRVGGSDGDDARAVATREVGGGGLGVYVAGTFRGVAFFGATPLQSRGAGDLFAIRLFASGNVGWAQQIGGGGFDYARGIAASVYPSDPIWVAGSFEDTILIGSTVLTSAGNSDALLATLTGDTGAPSGGIRIGGAGFDIANGIATDEFSAVGAVGYVEGPFTVTDATGTSAPRPGLGSVDAFAFVRGAGMGEDSLYVLGGPDADRGYGVGGAANVVLAFTGAFRQTGTFGGTPLVSAGSNDVFTFSVVTGCGVCPANEPGPEAALDLRAPVPNPATGRATLALTLDRARAVTVAAYDALGRRVAVLHDGHLPAGRTELALDAAALAPGVYVVRAAGEGAAAVRRLAVGR